jgi:hypothetical protein
MNEPSDDYRVGYGRPPLHSRWRKGLSGNPRHRKPKIRESAVETIDSLLLAPIQITLSGETKTVSALEAIILQLIQKSMAGNSRASRVLLRYQEFANRNLEKKLELTFVDSDYTRALTRQLPSSIDHE